MNTGSRGFHAFRIVRTFVIVNIGWYFDRIIHLRSCLQAFAVTLTDFRLTALKDGIVSEIIGHSTLFNIAGGYAVAFLGLILVFADSIQKERGCDVCGQIIHGRFVRKGLLKKVLVHPCMIAVYIGLFLMLTGIPLPGFMDKTVSALSSCTTAMTMVYIGTILSDVDWKTIVTGKQLYFSVMRLVIIPLIVWLPCRFLHVDPLITGVSVFLAAMPAGSTTSLLAAKYGADADSAAKCVVLSTALSVITVPVWGLLLGGI